MSAMLRRLGIGVLCLSCVAVGGCRQLFNDDDYRAFDASLERLHDIDKMDLASASTTTPVTVDDVASEPADVQSLVIKAPETLELTLAEARAATLANNLELQTQLLAPAIAETTIDAEEAKFEAVFFGSMSKNEVDSPTSVSTQGSKVTSDSGELGVRVPLRSGGTATLSLPSNKTSTNNSFSTLDPAYTADMTFSVSQPFLRNAGARFNTHSIRVAKYESQISQARTKLEAIRLLANADRAYWRLFAARRELDVRIQQYDLANEQLERADRRVRQGDVAEIEVIRAQSGLASRLEAIIIAQTTVRLRERELKRLMNRADVPVSSETSIFNATLPNPLGLTLDGEALASQAVDQRMEMLELELQLAIDASNVALRRNQRLPLVTLDYRYNINGLGSSYMNAWDQVGDHDFADWRFGLSAEIPIGNEAARARLQGALLTRLQRLATKAQRTQAIREEVFNALDQLEQNWQRILAARQEVMLAARTLEAEQNQFDNDLRTSTDVLDAAASLADAQSREIRALTDYEISMVDLAFATGTLLGKGQIRWEAAPAFVEDGQIDERYSPWRTDPVR